MMSERLIDLQILDGADWRPADFARALASAERQQVNVHIVPWLGEYGRSRAAGCRAGTAPYLAFLNADDELIPGGLAALLDVLGADASLCGAYGGEERLHADGTVRTRIESRWSPVAQLTGSGAQHNGCLMRRSAVMPYVDEIATAGIYSDRLLHGLMVQSGPWRAVEVMVYRWFVRSEALHTQDDPDRGAKVVQRLAPILMARAR